MKIYFSDFFNVAPELLEEYGAFNISLINDLPLFIDPFLLFNSEKPEYRTLHDGIIRYVAFLREQSVNRQGRLPKGLLLNWYKFKEVRQNWLGYSKVGNRGSALGAKFAASLNKSLYTLFPTFGEDETDRISASSHLEKVCLVSDGVGRDNISDFTTNLIKEYLLEYTQMFAVENIEPQYRRRRKIERVRFNYSTKSWMSVAYDLPHLRGDYVLLTPKDLLSKDEMWINRDDLYEQYEDIALALPNSELRDLVNEYFRSVLPLNAKKEEKRDAIKRVVQRYPEVLEYYIQRKEEAGAEAVASSAEQVIETETLFVEQVRQFVETYLADTSFYTDLGYTVEATRTRALFLKNVIETSEGYKVLYVGNKPLERESDLQVLQQLIWYAEQPTMFPSYHGNGTVNGKEKSPIEFKLASNNHLGKVLHDYAKARTQPTQVKILVRVIFYFSAQEGQKTKAYLQEFGLENDPNVILIDATARGKKSMDASSTNEKTSPQPRGLMSQRLVHWLHLSDFHVGKDEYGQRQLFKQILKHIAQRKHQGHTPDFVFITGDIANKGKKTEYDQFIDEFYSKLCSTLGEDWQGKIYTIPGNHDVDRDEAKAVQRYRVLERIPAFLDPTQKGLNERRPLLPRFQGFIDSALPPGAGAWLSSKEGAYSEVVDLKGYSVGIVGLNTAWLSESDKDEHELTPGKDITENALEAVTNADIVIVLGHHPIDWLLRRDVRPIRSLFGQNEVIYLHGHLHEARSHRDEGSGGQFLTLQSGAAFQSREDEQWVNGLTWCTLDLEMGQVRAQPYQWSRDHQEWHIDSTAFANAYRERDEWIFPIPTSRQTTSTRQTDIGTPSVVAQTKTHTSQTTRPGNSGSIDQEHLTISARLQYIEFVTDLGTDEDAVFAIQDTFEWLIRHPDNLAVATALLSLVRKRGTREHVANALRLFEEMTRRT